MNVEEDVKTLENKFDEYRVYGDERDLELFDFTRESTDRICTVPIKAPYIYPELKNDLSNQLNLSSEEVRGAIPEFVKYKLRNWTEVVMYRRIEDKLTDDNSLDNNCAIPLSTYTLLNTTRRTDPTKARKLTLRMLKNIQTINSYKYGEITKKEFLEAKRRAQEEFKTEREKPRSLFQLKNDNELVIQHIEKYIGKIGKSIHDQKFERAPLSVHIIPKIHDQDYSAVITTGLSHAPMYPPRPMDFFKYSELLIKLPLDWPLPKEVIKDDEFLWPIGELLSLMKYIHNNQQWFSDKHTFGNGNPPLPFAKNTGLCGFLFMFPLISFPPEFCELKIDDYKSVVFLQLVPIYKEEMDLALVESSDSLLERIEKNEIPDHLDIRRENIFGLNKPDYTPSESKGYFCPNCSNVLKGFKPEGVRCFSCKRVVVMNSSGKLISLDIPDEKPSLSEKKRQKAEKLFMEGLSLFKQLKGQKALDKFNAAIKLNPYDRRVYSVKMEVLNRLGRYKEARDSAKEGMKYSL